MLIDWFTVAAQVVNFLVLVYLLKRFLYGPIISAMDRREERIAERLEEGRRMEREAERAAEEHRRKTEELDSRSTEILDEAKHRAEEKKKELIDEARKEVEAMKASWRKGLRDEKDSFLKEFRTRAGREIIEVARRALGDLSGADLEHRVLEVFLEKLGELPPERLEEAGPPEKGLTVRTSFELDGEGKRRLEGAIKEKLPGGPGVSYEVTDELLCGVELRGKGFLIGWSLAGYMKELQEEVERILEEGTEAGEPA